MWIRSCLSYIEMRILSIYKQLSRLKMPEWKQYEAETIQRKSKPTDIVITKGHPQCKTIKIKIREIRFFALN